jgi:hypothetical protein
MEGAEHAAELGFDDDQQALIENTSVDDIAVGLARVPHMLDEALARRQALDSPGCRPGWVDLREHFLGVRL